MKKSLLALATLAAAGVASAQSTVTLYGIADAYFGSQKTNTVGNNGGALTTSSVNNTAVNNGGLQGSRWGLKVNEDLGGGMRAYATFEQGFNIDKGTAANTGSDTTSTGFAFSRQAFVGLGGSFGSVQLGRNYGGYYDVHSSNQFGNLEAESAFDATNGSFGPTTTATGSALISEINARKTYNAAPSPANASALAADINALNLGAANGVTNRAGAWIGYTPRINNSVRYDTPTMGGFKATLTYGLGENKTATTDATHIASGAVTYSNGPLNVALAYQDELIATSPSDVKLSNTYLGGSYNFGPAILSAAYNRAKLTGADVTEANGTTHEMDPQKEYVIGVAVPFGATTILTQYSRSKGDDLGKNEALGIEAQYAMSKRTTAYVGYNETKFFDGLFKDNLFGVGIRHKF